MSRYASDSRERVRDAVDMVRLVESRVELRKAGYNSYFGCCPFHDERTASFHVRPDEKHYHCFGCSESGDPFDFVMQTEGLDFMGALESLAARFGVTLETVDEDPEAARLRQRRERLYSLLTRTATFYERMFWESPQGGPARDYLLEERGLDPDVLRSFRVGWAPDAWDRVLLGSRNAGFSDEEMLAAGLIQPSSRDESRVYDRFRAQIMFPTADVKGRVVGFGARKLPGDSREWLGKYINTREGDIYSKRAALYGINEARGPAAKAGHMVLAEGYTDVIALHQAGVKNAVGIMGTSLTKEQVSELVRLVKKLELCLDADNAGQEAMARAAQLCAETGLELRVVALPSGADPGELIKTAGADALRERVATSQPYVVFEVDRILARADLGSAEGKDAAIAAFAPALKPVPESVLLDELRRRIAGALAISETRLITLLAGARTDAPSSSRRLPPPAADHEGPPNHDGPGPGWEPEEAGPLPQRPRKAPPARGGADVGIMRERNYLAMCLAGGEAGRHELAALDPDALLTSAVLRAAVRRLTGQLEISPGVVAVSGQPGAVPEVGDDEISRAIDDLESRAAKALAAGRTVSAAQLEHARVLLELADVERQIDAVGRGQGVPFSVSARKRELQAALSQAVGNLEQPL